MLILSANCVISNPAGAGIFAINYVKVNVLVVTLSANNNTRLLQQLKSDLNTQLIVGPAKWISKWRGHGTLLSATMVGL